MSLPQISIEISTTTFSMFCKKIKEVGMRHRRHIVIESGVQVLYELLHDNLAVIMLHFSIIECKIGRYIQIGGVSLRVAVGLKRKQSWQIKPKKLMTFTLYLRISELMYIDPVKLLHFNSFDSHKMQLLARRIFPSMFNLQELWKGPQDYVGTGRAEFGFTQQNCILKPFVRNILKMHDRYKYQYIFNNINDKIKEWHANDVCSFISSVNQHFFKMLTKQEHTVLMKAVKDYTKLSKFEYITWDLFMPQFLNCASSFFNRLPNPALTAHSFIYWYFKQFLKPLLLQFFYITDSDFYGNKLFFIPRKQWNEIKLIHQDLFISTNFKKLDCHDDTLGTSKLRLLPKSKGVRPILNLSHKNENGPSINAQLKNAFSCCFMELKALKFGQCNVFSVTNLSMLEPFFRLMKSQQSPLYVVKTDFESAYDSIDQSLALALVKSLLTKQEYPIIEYFEVGKKDSENWFCKQSKKALTGEHSIKLSDNLHLFAKRQTYLEATNSFSYFRRSDILDLISTHITNNVVTINNVHYKQEKGIPQGSILSGTLCTLIFHDFLQRISSQILNKSISFVAHFIDDVLFFSRDKAQCELFIKSVSKPENTHGLRLNIGKTWTNYKIQDSEVTEFKWCGFLIKLDPFELKRDYSKYVGREIRYFMTIGNLSKIPQIFQVHLLDMLYNDINREEIILLNLIQHTLLCSYKSVALLKVLKSRGNLEVESIKNEFMKAVQNALRTLKSSYIKSNRSKCENMMLFIIQNICKHHQINIKFVKNVAHYKMIKEEMEKWNNIK